MNSLKELNTVIAICVSVLLLASGCTKQSDPSPSMSASVNGALFNAIGYRVTTVGAQAAMTSVSATNLPVTGNPIATNISINVYNALGTYAFTSPSGNSNVAIYFSSAATGGLPVPATSGQVKVTNSSAHFIQGTFNFTCSDTASSNVVTSGQFTGKY